MRSESGQARACQTALPSDVRPPEMRNSRVTGRRAGTPPSRSLVSPVGVFRPTALRGRSQITWNAKVGDNLPARGQGSAGPPWCCRRVAATPHGGGFRCAASGNRAVLREPATLSALGGRSAVRRLTSGLDHLPTRRAAAWPGRAALHVNAPGPCGFRASRREAATAGQAARPGTGRQSTLPSGSRQGRLPGLVAAATEFIDHHLPHAEFLRFAGNGHRDFRYHADETGNLVVRDVSLTEAADVLF